MSNSVFVDFIRTRSDSHHFHKQQTSTVFLYDSTVFWFVLLLRVVRLKYFWAIIISKFSNSPIISEFEGLSYENSPNFHLLVAMLVVNSRS